MLLQALAQGRGHERYLEIGSGTGQTLRAVPCRTKYGVDVRNGHGVTHQMTSDAFFAGHAQALAPFDLVFIDGLHHDKQARRDIVNAYELLSYGGCVVVAGVNPKSQDVQAVPKRAKSWTGDVWKAWVRLRATGQMPMGVLDVEQGLGIIDDWLCEPEPLDLPNRLTYDWLEANRTDALGIMTMAEALVELGLS